VDLRIAIVCFLAFVAIAAGLPVMRRAADYAWFVTTLATEPPPVRLVMPVDRVNAPQLADSWHAPRQVDDGKKA
jgi:hypothetical protein